MGVTCFECGVHFGEVFEVVFECLGVVGEVIGVGC